MDDFRLGVQKCQKTIDDGVGNAGKESNHQSATNKNHFYSNQNFVIIKEYFKWRGLICYFVC